ncbi:MAG TPA: DPP IV N-terminal domain-containing protein [Gemmatimonadales bacterium]|jgi:dipeptidyl aminopeptidase/acylaminoacyl peptidase
MRNHLPLLLVLAAAPLQAQQPRALTADDYARAERFMGYNTNQLVSNGAVRPVWLPDGRFWYRNQTANGTEFVMVDPVRRSREVSAEAADLARSDSTAARGRRRADPALANSAISPDSTKAAFIRDYNLWVRDVATGRETQLTTDGVANFGYATDNAGWTKSDRAIVLWSPDSKKIATYQQDERHVGDMYLVQTRPGHPELEAWKYPLAGDSVIQMIQRVIIDLDGPRVIRLQMPPDAHRSTLCDHIVCGGRWADVEWSPDATQLAFVSTARDHRHEWVRVADARTGAVREVFDESDPYFLESGFNKINWHTMWQSNELLWYSERSDWGHLYLYDLASGRLKNAITSGNWKVLQVLRADSSNRTIWFTASGKESGDPYFQHFYSVRMDGSHLTALTPDSANHEIAISPDGRFFVDTWSRPDAPPVSQLRDMTNGRLVVDLERADISRLTATGWRPPMPIMVKARDGRTDLYGLLYRPASFDSTRRYPIINHIYPGPQVGSVGSRSFSAARGDNQALAELGFVVVEIDAMGTPMRSHSFQAAYAASMGDNGLPDQIAGMRELAQRYPWIDIDKAAIWGHSGGGYAAADGILRYPDFFKVAISEAGNHDNREYEDDWGEKWQGLVMPQANGHNSYDDQANQNLAKNLRGHLLIAHGTTDNNVPPYNTLLLINELIRNNRDFDLLLLPNRRHGFGNEPYMIRRRWDYFVRYLLGAEPPFEYEMHPPATPGFRPGTQAGP